MGSLNSLERQFPIIDSNFRQFCASHGIFTVEDFLINDLYVLVAFAEKQSSTERLKQGVTQVLSLIDGRHQPWSNGMELLKDAQQNKNVLPTGCEGIDLLLRGGFCKGQLIELVGPSASGKTQVCLQAVSNVANNYVGRIVFLDTSNSFSAKRIAHIIGQTLDPAYKEVKHKIIQKVMSNILCHSVYDIFGMFDVLHQLESNMRSGMQAGDDQLHLLIVDSISSLITIVLGGSRPHGHALMISAGFLLKKLAHEHNLSVVVTNHMVGGRGGIPKPALGESWKSIPHVRLMLSRDRESNTCNISILKHPSMASHKAATFRIFD